MHCELYSPPTGFLCSFLSVVFLFKEVFGAFPVERKERNIKLWNATKSEIQQTNFHLEDKKKIRNDGCINIRCALSLPHCFNVTLCP